jgi:signal transduction histidine kinase
MDKNGPKLTPDVINTLESLWKLEKIILDTLDFREVLQKVVDAILHELGYLHLGYKVVVLALIDEESNTLKRVSLSQTEEARKTREVSEMPFEDIVIPMDADKNLCIKAIKENQVQITHHFPDILTPPISEENALESQKNAGIKTSMVYPLNVRGKTIGIMIFSMVKGEEEVTQDEKNLLKYFTDLVALAVENAKLYSNLEKESLQLEEANKKLKKAYDDLLKLDKLKDEFLSVTSHELRTPMTIIKSYIWMVAQNKAGDINEKQKEYLEKAMEGVERMLNLINDMLNISRIEQNKVKFEKERFNLAECIKQVIEDFKLETEENSIYLNYCCENDQIDVIADKNKVIEVITNLIGNSIKFTKDGGITVEIEESKDQILVSVKDTGAGVNKDDLKRLFHKFGRLDSSYQTVAESGGTGLGLYIVKLYIEGMGGKVGAESEGKNKGSNFWFLLPKAK